MGGLRHIIDCEHATAEDNQRRMQVNKQVNVFPKYVSISSQHHLPMDHYMTSNSCSAKDSNAECRAQSGGLRQRIDH